jgi:hypothetical protein
MSQRTGTVVVRLEQGKEGADGEDVGVFGKHLDNFNTLERGVDRCRRMVSGDLVSTQKEVEEHARKTTQIYTSCGRIEAVRYATWIWRNRSGPPLVGNKSSTFLVVLLGRGREGRRSEVYGPTGALIRVLGLGFEYCQASSTPGTRAYPAVLSFFALSFDCLSGLSVECVAWTVRTGVPRFQ